MSLFKNLLLLPWLGGNKTNIGVEKAPKILSKLIDNNFNTNLIKTISNNNLKNCDYHYRVYTESQNLKGNILNIGGDHSISIGTTLSTINKYSSLTKNIHGMPLSFITGLENKWSWTSNLNFLKFEDLHYWGIRDIDLYEKDIILKKKINVHYDVKSVLNIINKYDYLHISLDIDAIDPIYTPSTGTPVKNGLMLDDVNHFLEEVRNNKTHNFNLDIVEYNPSIGLSIDKLKTLDSMEKILLNI